MLELTATAVFVGYIIYLRYYADQRTNAEKEAEQLQEGIALYTNGQFGQALDYFNRTLVNRPRSAVAYLYRARCYRAMGNSSAALADLSQGKSYDDTIADLHLESGQIHAEQQDYKAAFLDFDKAIFHSHGEQAEPFRWRGLARRHLGEEAEAQQDIARAAQIEQQRQTQPSIAPTAKASFFDRKLALNAVLTLMISLILLYIIKKSTVIHWPYLWAAMSAVGIGFIEPRKGWVLALFQVFVILLGYYVIVGPSESSTHREVETFSLFGSVGLTFAGSLIGSVLKKAQV